MTSRRQRSRAQSQSIPLRVLQPAAPEPVQVTEDTPRLHYRGDRTKYLPEQAYGPDAYGAFYRVISAEYSPELDRTTLYFRPIAPAEVAAA